MGALPGLYLDHGRIMPKLWIQHEYYYLGNHDISGKRLSREKQTVNDFSSCVLRVISHWLDLGMERTIRLTTMNSRYKAVRSQGTTGSKFW